MNPLFSDAQANVERKKPESNQNQTRIKPESNQNQTRIKPESNQNQTRIKPESNQNQTRDFMNSTRYSMNPTKGKLKIAITSAKDGMPHNHINHFF
ncbi:hypothetical protein [Yersinia frederiksenii]|uniref:hypothetical protein n=1 Tax=Yersinia frederiksenii TaxID=29484 RepID=UPI0011A19C29|nr:hypothetical protein [Yersinia frederiksenii]